MESQAHPCSWNVAPTKVSAAAIYQRSHPKIETLVHGKEPRMYVDVQQWSEFEGKKGTSATLRNSGMHHCSVTAAT